MEGALEEDKYSFRALNAQELEQKEHLIQSVGNIAAEIGFNLSDNGKRSDLAVLEEVLEHLSWMEHGEVCFVAVGLAFGTVLAATEPLEWVKFQDKWGEEISLKLRGYEYFIHPVSMMTKRAEKEEQIDLQYLFDELVRRVHEDGTRNMPTPN